MKNNNNIEDFLKVKEELDKISVSSEVIGDLNELINEKLDTLNKLKGKENIDILAIYDVLRLNNNYITLNYLITNELQKINESVELAYKLLNQIQETDEEHESNNKGGVSDE